MARSDQQSIPGTEPKIPAAVLRQANKVLDLRDELELAKQRHELAGEYLQSAMAKAEIETFRLPGNDRRPPVVFRITVGDPKIKIEDYKKPVLEGSATSETIG